MIKVDTDSFVPIFEQIKQGIKRDITSGVLKPQQVLSSIRDLAADLIVNPNTVARAYRELEMEGFIETRQGRGSLVAGNSAALAKQEREAILDRIFNEAVAEARRFHLNDAEILRLFERKLRAGGGDVATGEPKVKGDKHE
jgi:GntR family transcriptional regulator